MKEPVWLSQKVVEAAHDAQLAEHGGSSGIRDAGLLDSALAFARNQFVYGETDLFRLAAGYAFAIARNHAFVDGNKRTAFLAAYGFLALNGWDFDAPEVEVVMMTQDLAAGAINQDGYAEWLQRSSKPL